METASHGKLSVCECVVKARVTVSLCVLIAGYNGNKPTVPVKAYSVQYSAPHYYYHHMLFWLTFAV